MGKIRKVKTLPIAIGSKKDMQDEKQTILRRHPNAKVTLKPVKHPAGFVQLRVTRRMYEKLRR